jgi:hypothetical protein
MTAGTLKQIKQFLPKNDKETLYFAIAFFAGVAVSWMFLKKKNEKIEGMISANGANLKKKSTQDHITRGYQKVSA